MQLTISSPPILFGKTGNAPITLTKTATSTPIAFCKSTLGALSTTTSNSSVQLATIDSAINSSPFQFGTIRRGAPNVTTGTSPLTFGNNTTAPPITFWKSALGAPSTPAIGKETAATATSGSPIQLTTTDPEDSNCIACNSVTSVAKVVERLSKTEEAEEEEFELKATTTNATVGESKEPNLFQNKNEEFYMLSGSNVFTIERGQSSKADFKIVRSSRKKRSTPLHKSTTNRPEESDMIKRLFGTNTQVKFTFSIQVSLGFPLSIRQFDSSTMLRLSPVTAKDQKGSVFQVSPANGYNFTPYVIEEPAQEQFCQGLTNPISTVIDNDDNDACFEDPADSIDEGLINSSPEYYQNATGRLILMAKRHRNGTGKRDHKAFVKPCKEDIEVMFSHRVKLYRFSSGEKLCKERGVGSINILRNGQSGKMGLFMRQDQAPLKVYANLQITTDMKVQPNAGLSSSWVWITLADLPEQRCKAEQLAVRFRSKEIAKDFKQTFEICQDILKYQTPMKKLQEDKGNKEVREDSLPKPKTSEASWGCDVCMLRNDSDKVKCVACGSTKQRAKPKFPFRSTSPSTGSGLPLGSAALSTGPALSYNQTPYSGVKCQDLLNTQRPETIIQEHQRHKEFKKKPLAKLKAAEGPWPCDICMVTNGSNKIECAACGGMKPKAESSQDQDKESKTFALASATPLFSFGSATLSTGPVVSYNQTPYLSVKCEEILNIQRPVKIIQEDQEHDEFKKERLAKIKPAEGLWECSICMVRNGSNAIECAACGSLKPGIEQSQDQKTNTNSFLFASATPSFSFGSSTVSTGPVVSYNQTPYSSVSCRQERLNTQRPVTTIQEDQEHDEFKKEPLAKLKPSDGAWECDICMVRNATNKIECATCGGMKPKAESSQDQDKESKTFALASATPSFSFGSATLSTGPVVSHNQTPYSSVKCQERLNTQWPVKIIQDDQEHDEFKKERLDKIKPAEGLWECSICMVRNGSNAVECAACGSLKPGAEQSQDQKTNTNSFLFASATPSFSFGSSTVSTGPVVSYNQTPYSSVSCRQERLNTQRPVTTIQEDQEHDEFKKEPLTKLKPSDGAWECDICMVRNATNKIECAACGGMKPKAESSQDQDKESKTFALASATPSFSFGSATLSTGPVVSHNQTPYSSVKCQERLNTQWPVKIIQEDQEHDEFKKERLDKIKPAEGLWECSICMVRNGSNAVECAACGSLKPGAEQSQDQKTNTNSFLFASATPSFSFGSATLSIDPVVSYNQTPYSSVKCQERLNTQRPVKIIQEDQGHEEFKEEPLAKFKVAEGSWECDLCMVRNDSDKGECATCGGLKPRAASSQDQMRKTETFLFASATSPSSSVSSFGSVPLPTRPECSSDHTPSSVVECQEMLKTQTPVRTHQDNEGHDEVSDSLFRKCKVAEGSWECDICMVRNDSDDIACVACGGPKPGADQVKTERMM